MSIFQPDGKPLLSKLMVKYPPELDVTQLQKILRVHWKAYLAEKPSLELCKSLIMLRDINISGRINMLDIPVLMHMLQFWKVRRSSMAPNFFFLNTNSCDAFVEYIEEVLSHPLCTTIKTFI